jgi:hypothetical protein
VNIQPLALKLKGPDLVRSAPETLPGASILREGLIFATHPAWGRKALRQPDGPLHVHQAEQCRDR